MSAPNMSAVNAPKPFYVPAEGLRHAVEDPARGVFYLHGDDGGLSLITGEVRPSNALPGALSVETEHGTTYLDLGSEVEVVED